MTKSEENLKSILIELKKNEIDEIVHVILPSATKQKRTRAMI